MNRKHFIKSTAIAVAGLTFLPAVAAEATPVVTGLPIGIPLSTDPTLLKVLERLNKAIPGFDIVALEKTYDKLTFTPISTLWARHGNKYKKLSASFTWELHSELQHYHALDPEEEMFRLLLFYVKLDLGLLPEYTNKASTK